MLGVNFASCATIHDSMTQHAVRHITRHFAGLDAQEATMVSIDRLGFIVRARTAEGMQGARIAFPEEVRSREDARRVLVAMTRKG
jgi:hypothetical protein